MGGPFNSGLDCKEAVQPKELSCNVTLNNNQQKRSRVWTSWKDIYFALFHFVKEVFKGSTCWAEKLSWTQPPQLFSLSCFLFLFLPQSLFVQEVSRIMVPSTHKASTWEFVHHSCTCPAKRSRVIWTFIISIDLLPVVFLQCYFLFLLFFFFTLIWMHMVTSSKWEESMWGVVWALVQVSMLSELCVVQTEAVEMQQGL